MSAQPPDLTQSVSDIQGNVLEGFSKDHQTFLFFAFLAEAEATAWILDLVNEIATVTEVQSFNRLFKTTHDRRNGRETGIVKSLWMNLAFTANGLKALGQSVEGFPAELVNGMAASHTTLGDGDSVPGSWIPPFNAPANIHAVMLLAADDPDDLQQEISNRLSSLPPGGVELVGREDGNARVDEPGHEHFGFKDGISQPGIAGYTDPTEADPGQDLIQPGEFLLGYPTGEPVPPDPGSNNPYGPQNPPPEFDPTQQGPPSGWDGMPDWAVNASFLVFRKLRQDVVGFEQFITTNISDTLSRDQLYAKLVGRYRSGAPLETNAGEQVDPGVANAALVDDSVNNDFDYVASGDADGHVVPRAAHIRKAYPRDQVPPTDVGSEKHRLLRRGIAYGASYEPGSTDADASGPTADRGLLFLCYQSSIADQFEFVQSQWVNDPAFPQDGQGATPGPDPIIGQPSGDFDIPGDPTTPVSGLPAFVTTRGGEYFIQPSVSGIQQMLGADPSAGGG